MYQNMLPALALLLSLLRGKGLASSNRVMVAVHDLCHLGLTTFSIDGWRVELTPFGTAIAKTLEARRLPLLRSKRQAAYHHWMNCDSVDSDSKETSRAVASFEWYDHCVMLREDRSRAPIG
jgi:hypothetical protein